MEYAVFHMKDEHFRDGTMAAYDEGPCAFPEQYRLVAVVEVPELAQVFPATNHIDHPWQENVEVVAAAPGRQRSTSVGDVAVNLEMMSAFRCAPVGWKDIPTGHGQIAWVRDEVTRLKARGRRA